MFKNNSFDKNQNFKKTNPKAHSATKNLRIKLYGIETLKFIANSHDNQLQRQNKMITTKKINKTKETLMFYFWNHCEV